MMTLEHFKKSMIIFWFVWWAITFWTDIAGGLAHMGYLNASFTPDTNYPFLVASLAMYHPPAWLPVVFYIAIILGSFICTALFARGVLALRQNQFIWIKHAKTAFIFSLWFWLAFFIADQLVMKFDLEENHMVQGGFELLCFLALYILPEA